MINLDSKKKIIILSSILIFLVVAKINAQSFGYNLQTSSLTFDYSTLSNYTTPRTYSKAFTLSINNSNRGKYNIFCKIMVNSSLSIANTPTSLFSVKVNSANFNINSNYYQPVNIGLSDVLVGNVSGRGGRSDTINYDLILNPIGLNYEPDNYNYSFMFTVSEY